MTQEIRDLANAMGIVVASVWDGYVRKWIVSERDGYYPLFTTTDYDTLVQKLRSGRIYPGQQYSTAQKIQRKALWDKDLQRIFAQKFDVTPYAATTYNNFFWHGCCNSKRCANRGDKSIKFCQILLT